MVLGDDDRRVVVSVAVRHGTVDVAIRADDPTLAQAIARTQGELEHALRGHGLALGDLSSRGRDHDRGHSAGPRNTAVRFARAAADEAAAQPTPRVTAPRLRALA